MRTLQLKTVLFNLAIVLFTLGVTGCVLKEPLSDSEQAKPDEHLFGAWKVEDMKIEGVRKKQEEYCILTIGKAELRGAPPGILKAIEISNNAEQKLEVKDLYFFTTSIGARAYANILEDYFDDKRKEQKWDKTSAKRCSLVKYEVADDRLTIWMMNGREAAKAITKGDLKGTVEEKGFLKIQSTMIDGGADLARFLSKGGDEKLFTDEGKLVFSRIK